MVFMAKLLGKEFDAVLLFSSLIVDSGKVRGLLDWHPITTMEEQLCKITANEKNIWFNISNFPVFDFTDFSFINSGFGY